MPFFSAEISIQTDKVWTSFAQFYIFILCHSDKYLIFLYSEGFSSKLVLKI
jgi:hypothetical protein